MQERRVTPIRNGTVIDHLPANSSLHVLRILGYLNDTENNTTSVLINVPSRKAGSKDLIKVENRELTAVESDKIGLVSWTYRPKRMPTINIIREYRVAEKRTIDLAERYEWLVYCQNRTDTGGCISHTERWMKGTIIELRNGDFFCYYCDRRQEPKELRKNIK